LGFTICGSYIEQVWSPLIYALELLLKHCYAKCEPDDFSHVSRTLTHRDPVQLEQLIFPQWDCFMWNTTKRVGCFCHVVFSQMQRRQKRWSTKKVTLPCNHRQKRTALIRGIPHMESRVGSIGYCFVKKLIWEVNDPDIKLNSVSSERKKLKIIFVRLYYRLQFRHTIVSERFVQIRALPIRASRVFGSRRTFAAYKSCGVHIVLVRDLLWQTKIVCNHSTSDHLQCDNYNSSWHLQEELLFDLL